MPLPHPIREVGDFFRAALVVPVPRDHQETDRAFRRRRIVAVATLVVGAACLAWTLRIEPGDPLFYWATLLMAVTWTVGALLSGPMHLGWAHTREGWRAQKERTYGRPWFQAFTLGLLLLGLFLVGAFLVQYIPFLRDPVLQLLDHAGEGSLALIAMLTAINGIAEEMYFRGALYAAIGRRYAVAGSTIAYALVTATSGIFLLVFAATLLGVLVGLQRRVTGGLLAPVVTHLTWSLGMLFLLPLILG